MPQLDPSSFPSQLFWLIISFAILYSIMVRKVLPKITNVVQNRQDKIANDLEKANRLKEEAENLEAEYKSSLEKTRHKANSIVAKANTRMSELAVKKHEEMDNELFKKGLEAQEKISAARSKAVNDLSSVASELSSVIVEKLASLKVGKKEADKVVKTVLKNKTS